MSYLKEDRSYVVIMGNIDGGFQVVGPFKGGEDTGIDDALEYAMECGLQTSEVMECIPWDAEIVERPDYGDTPQTQSLFGDDADETDQPAPEETHEIPDWLK